MRVTVAPKRLLAGATLLATCFTLVGCPAPTIDRTGLDESIPPLKVKPTPPIATAPVGFPVGPSNYLIHLIPLHARPDPFALLPNEQLYEGQQMAAFFATSYGGWPLFYPGPNPPPPTPEIEPQPHRRLAGILIGDSVTALIDMGDGSLREIHPGEAIPGTEWSVVSIDEEKAVLRRTVPGKLPGEVVVRLESAEYTPPAQPTEAPNPGGNPGRGAGPPAKFGRGGGFGGR